MSGPITLTVEFDIGRMTPNRLNRMIWQQRRNLAMVAKVAGSKAWREAGCPVLNVPVTVDWTIRRARKLDPDAALASLKAVIDSLFVGRITPADSEKWIYHRVVRQEIGREWKGKEQILVRVTPQHAATADDGGCPAAESSLCKTSKPDPA